MEKSASRPFWLTLIVFTFIFSLFAARATYLRSADAGMLLQRSIWGGMLLVYSATAIALYLALPPRRAFWTPAFFFWRYSSYGWPWR